MLARLEIADARFGADGCEDTSSGGSSPASLSGPSDSDGSSTADEYCADPRDFRRHVSLPSSPALDEVDPSSLRPISPSSSCILADIDKHLQRMDLLLPAFSSPATAARAVALSSWLAGFGVGWVLDMDATGNSGSLPWREIGRRVRVWVQALSTMDRVFRRRHLEARNPINDAAAAQLAALGELVADSAGAMLKLAVAVAALGSSPPKLHAALDVYVPVSEAYPGLARMFSWGTSHPVSAASDAALAGLVDACRRCVRDPSAFIRAHYPWRMPQAGEVHPCVVYWMGYFRYLLRNRVSLYFVLAGGGEDEPTAPFVPGEGGLVTELISCLETMLEEKSGALAFPGLRQVFMLNNMSAIVCRAVRSDLNLFLPPGWVRTREERMDGYVKGYVDAAWAPVVSRLDCGGAKPAAVNILRRRSPLSAFYSALENACSMHRGWKVPNPVLRGVLRRTVSEKVVPAYRRYLEDYPEVEVPAGSTAEELEHQLSELFEG